MAFTIADRVQQTATTEGTGSYTLSTTVSGFRSFSAAIGNNQVAYTATMGNQFEVGVGTLSGSTLTRAVVYSSSNGNNLVNWTAGTKQVFVDLPAIYLDQIYKYAPKYVGTFTGSGSTNWIATPVPPIYSYWSGLTIIGLVHVSSDIPAPTLNVNGLGAKTVRSWNGNSIPFTAYGPGDMLTLIYNGTDFMLQQVEG